MLMPDSKPYVRFFYEEQEDRNATQESGIYTAKNVAMVEVTQAGGKSVFVDEADNWLKKITEASHQQRFNPEWARDFKEMFKLFKEGEEIPEKGIAIRMCLMFSPAEQKMILNANVRTLEDLANCNEEAIQAMGPGGRALRDRARTAIEQSKDAGKIAMQVQDLQVKLEEMERQNEELRAALHESGITEKRGPGRPRKVATE